MGTTTKAASKLRVQKVRASPRRGLTMARAPQVGKRLHPTTIGFPAGWTPSEHLDANRFPSLSLGIGRVIPRTLEGRNVSIKPCLPVIGRRQVVEGVPARFPLLMERESR